MTIRCDRVWRNARLATMQAGLGEIDDGVIAAAEGRILYAGGGAAAPAFVAAESIDCRGRWITPGLIDCHTHLVHGGDRADEFERRLQGASYADIARAGGGIVATMRATRAASEKELVAAALPRLDALLAEGVTCVEVKSGYGLAPEHEAKQLRAARALGGKRRVTIVTSLLGAHAVPPEYRGDADGYITMLCDEMIPAIAEAGLADAVDGFCETIAFTKAQIERVFTAARKHGLPVKLHAEQLSHCGGADLAAQFGALSADHLEHLDEAGAVAMAQAGTVAVLLPGAYYCTGETQPPPIELLRRNGVRMAIATDCNPGTSPLTSPLLAMNMAATLFRMNVSECLRGFTIEAAHALGLDREYGSLEAGKYCDLAIWNIERPAQLVYRMGLNPLHARIWRGQ
jgi:imidazolonepropionase